MPDNDLGTAHGRIRITYEGKGADKTNASVAKMAAQFDAMQKRLAQVEKQLETANKELGKASTEMRKTSRSSRILDRDVLKTARRFRSFRSEVSMLKSELHSLGRFANNTHRNFQTLSTVMRVFNRAGQHAGNQQLAIFRSLSITMAELASRSEGTAKTINDVQRNVLTFFNQTNRLMGTRSVLTLVGSAWFSIRNRIFGVNNAIERAPMWVQKLNRFSQSVRYLSGAVGILAIAMGPFRLMERLAKTGVFNLLVRGTRNLATGFHVLGNVTERYFGKDYFSGFTRRLLRTEKSMTSFLQDAGTNFKRWSNNLSNNASRMLKWANDSKSLIGGMALIANSVTNLWGRFQWFFKLPKPLMAGLAIFFSRILPSALYATSKALVGTSNLVVGLVSGAKQLSGGLLVLPGILAGIAATASSLFPVFAGLSDKFKDLFSSDPTERWEALGKLPEHLRGIGVALQSFYPRWEEFQKSIQTFAFKGGEDQIRKLGDTYFPILEEGAKRVVGALRNAKDRLFEFSQEASVQADIKNIYGDTAQGVNQLSNAIKPALHGFMDLAAVGSEFLQTTSVWVPILTERFQQWTQANRENGNLMRWMQDARQGFFDLTAGLWDATKAAYKLLTIFADPGAGIDWLDRFADAMERLNERIDESSATGFLRDLREGVRDMGAKKIDDLRKIWEIFTETLESVAPFVQQISDSFSGIFIPAMERAMDIVQLFIDALTATGLDQFIGWILGIFGAVRLLPKVFSTAITALKLFGGTFLVLRDKQKVITGMTNALAGLGARMERVHRIGGTLGNGMQNVALAVEKSASVIGRLVSGLVTGGAAVLTFIAIVSEYEKQGEEFDKQIEKNKQTVIDFGNELRKSFTADRSLIGKNVLDTVNENIDETLNNLGDTIDKAPGFWSHIGDFFSRGLDRQIAAGAPTGIMEIDAFFAESPDINRRQAEGAAADMARAKLQQLKDEGVDLTAKIAGSDATYREFVENLRAQGREGEEAAKVLDQLRNRFTQIEKDMRVLGPAGTLVKEGIRQIGEAAADASQKLDGLRLVLEGLGYLKTNTLKATAEYQEAITTMADKVIESLNGIADADQAWNLQTNSLNLMSESGRALLDTLVPIADRFQALAANGGDVTQMWKDMQPEIDATVDALNNAGIKISREQFVDFLQKQLGAAPVPIQIALQTGDNSEAAKAFKEFMLRMQGWADTGVFVPIQFETEDTAKKWDQELEKILGQDLLDVNGTNLVLRAGVQLQADDLAQLQQKLTELGFKFGPGGPNVTPTITPPTQAPQAPGQAPPPQPPATPPQAPVAPQSPTIGTPAIAPPPLPGQIPATPTPQVIVGAPEVVFAALEQIKSKMKEIDEFNPTIDFNLDLTQTAIDRLNDVKTKIDEIKNQIEGDKIVIDIQVLHVNESNYDLERLRLKLNEVIGVVNALAGALSAAFLNAQGQITTFVNAAQTEMDRFADSGRNAGIEFDKALAAGLEQNSLAIKAAETMAQEIKDRFHSSPPKKGPLSEHGDAARYAGETFAQTYASGISTRAGDVTGAANRMAAGAGSAAMRGDKNYQAGQFLGQISSIVNFMSNAVDAFSKLANVILETAKFASDPLGKGTFFGKNRRFVRDPSLSEEERQKRREDAAQQRAFGFYGSGQRPDLYDPKTGRRKGGPVGSLGPTPEKQDIANYIIDKAMSLGYSRDQANQFLVQAVGESALDPTRTSPNGLWTGIFQYDTPTWEQAGGGDVKNAQQNIDNYFNLAAQRGLTPENFKDPHQLGTQVSIGGPLNPKNVGHEAGARDAAQQYIEGYQQGAGQFIDGIAPGVPAAIGNLPPSSKLNTGPGLEPAAEMVAAVLESQFPGITQIGGQDNRPKGTPQMHTKGRALDVGIGSDLATGDAIAKFVEANFASLGIQSYIWRNVGKNLVANEGGGPGSTYTSDGHFDHVHIQFADGGKLDVSPDGTMNMQIPANSPYKDLDYGLPLTPEERAKTPAPLKERVVRNPDGTFSPVHGTGDKPGPEVPINPATGKPWTPEEEAEFWNRPENALQYDASQVRPGDLDMPGVFQGTEDQMLEALKGNNPDLAKAIATAQDFTAGDEDVIDALSVLKNESQRQTELNTAEGRARASQLDSLISSAAGDRGLVEEPSPIDKASEIAGAATSIAGDVFAVLNSTIEAIGATKNITSTLARGVENTEDIYQMIDDIQKYIQLGADVAGAVSSITGTIGELAGAAGGMDMGASGAISAIGQIAGLVQAGLETANAIIDLGQEAYRIIGSYVGDFLGILTGGAGGALQGNVRFLLDETTNQLLAYSQDNPLDKRAHDLAWQQGNPDARNQLIGNINMYGGPGSDPRDMTRQMMFQVKASTMGQATGQ